MGRRTGQIRHQSRSGAHPARLMAGALALVTPRTGLAATPAWAGGPTSVQDVSGVAHHDGGRGSRPNWTVGFTHLGVGSAPGHGQHGNGDSAGGGFPRPLGR